MEPSTMEVNEMCTHILEDLASVSAVMYQAQGWDWHTLLKHNLRQRLSIKHVKVSRRLVDSQRSGKCHDNHYCFKKYSEHITTQCNYESIH